MVSAARELSALYVSFFQIPGAQPGLSVHSGNSHEIDICAYAAGCFDQGRTNRNHRMLE
jgi:hypothetical protein